MTPLLHFRSSKRSLTGVERLELRLSAGLIALALVLILTVLFLTGAISAETYKSAIEALGK